jgi:hypothetical protein
MPLPIIKTPFKRVAMDIVDPLPRSRSGKKYILVVCVYATRYPEAIALRTIDAAQIAEELVHIFARVGIPEEILTDQGTNFRSKLLSELYRLLHVQKIRTSPYHPQTDGFVEWFNQTLKSMLKKIATDDVKSWDKMLPYLLFAYREVPQSSTGFSPFELVYGRTVNGPLDVLEYTWEAKDPGEESVISHILSVLDKMEKMTELMKKNLTRAQEKQKKWYDQNARKREFHPGQQVLVLLLSSSSKLLAQWQGPYEVVERKGEVNYVINMHDRKKKKRLFHVNMLREWHQPLVERVMYAEQEVDEEEELHMWSPMVDQQNTGNELTYGSGLSVSQQTELSEMLIDFKDVLSNIPGRTHLKEHHILTGGGCPIRLPPYRLPQAYQEAVKQELDEMQRQGIIEPAASAWSAPIVIVPKKDGSLRLCVDFRRLNGLSEGDYPMPRIDELIDRVGNARYISVLDLTKRYWQVPIAKDGKPKTAFVTPFGLYQFHVMPFGLQGALATFQRLMDLVLRGLEEFSAAYIDDVVIYSISWKDHIVHLRKVLMAIRKAGLTVKPKKCQLGMNQCHYLGHIVGNGTVCPDPKKIEAVKSFPTPTTKKEVRMFLGLTGYYRRFIPSYSEVAAPLTDLTKKKALNTVSWTEEGEVAFQTLKTALWF